MVDQHVPGQSGSGSAGAAGCLLRVFWLFLGFIVLFFTGYFIATRPAAAGLSMSILDAVYWAVAAAMAGARYLDVRCCSGKTATGEPATAKHATRYALLLAAVAAAAWVGAHLVPLLGSRAQ